MIGNLYTDGGARGNPGPSAIGVVLRDTNQETIETLGLYLGTATNNVAEYTALVNGLKLAKEKGVTELNCFLDSELVVKQLTNIYRVKDATLKTLFDQVKILEKNFVVVKYTHIRREFNKEADAIVNQVLDSNS